ncbi:MAG: AlpA family transcriptional regulator [Bacteroidota bacterium]
MKQTVSDHTILRLSAVIQKTGLSRSSIYAFMKEKKFPDSIPLGARAVGWLKQDIEHWINERTRLSKHR